jgi:hypothetical protein
VTALVAAATRPIPTRLARVDEDPRVPAGARAFWREFAARDRRAELAAMPCRGLVYVGGADREYALGVRRTRPWLIDHGVTVRECDRLDHRARDDEPAVSTRVVPAVTVWLGSGRRHC